MMHDKTINNVQVNKLHALGHINNYKNFRKFYCVELLLS